MGLFYNDSKTPYHDILVQFLNTYKINTNDQILARVQNKVVCIDSLSIVAKFKIFYVSTRCKFGHLPKGVCKTCINRYYDWTSCTSWEGTIKCFQNDASLPHSVYKIVAYHFSTWTRKLLQQPKHHYIHDYKCWRSSFNLVDIMFNHMKKELQC